MIRSHKNVVSVTPRFSLENYELYSSWSNNEISGITGGFSLEFMVLFRVKFYYFNKYFKTSGSIPGIPFKTKINPGISNTEIKHFMNFKTDLNFRKETLIKLLNNIIIHEDEIIKALYDDFKTCFLKLS
jgi:hypothetical protein